MMPYPVSGSSADHAKTSGSMPVDGMVPGKLSARPDWDGADEKRAADGNCPDAAPAMAPVWSRYIDSRLKQFCTR